MQLASPSTGTRVSLVAVIAAQAAAIGFMIAAAQSFNVIWQGNSFLVAAIYGLAFSSVHLLAVWVALGPLPAMIRWSAAIGNLALVALALTSVLTVGGGPEYTEVLLVMSLALAAQFACAQLPLWFLRLRYGYRIDFPHTNNPGLASSQFTIRQLLIATAVVAVYLGIQRLLLPAGGWRGVKMPWQPLFAFGILVLFQAMMPVFVTAATLTRLAPAPCLVVLFICLVPLSLLEVQVFEAMDLGRSPDLTLILLGINCTQLTWLAGNLLILRGGGFRLACKAESPT